MPNDDGVPAAESNLGEHRHMARAQSWESDAIAAALRSLHEGVASSPRSRLGDRSAAAAYRSALDTDRSVVSLDELLRPYRHDGGFREIRQEITRARRIDQSCLLAMVDIDGHHRHSHAGEDREDDEAQLRTVAETMRSLLRRYDCIVRFGEDEFLCALLGLTMETATARFRLIKSTLAVKPEPASVTVGLEVMSMDDPLDDVVVRGKIAACRQHQHIAI
jgi:diguanylate cyclase (GGDEF)-like protein